MREKGEGNLLIQLGCNSNGGKRNTMIFATKLQTIIIIWIQWFTKNTEKGDHNKNGNGRTVTRKMQISIQEELLIPLW